jgi:hypothetical protein
LVTGIFSSSTGDRCKELQVSASKKVARRMKFSDYRDDPEIKFPAVRWILDKKIFYAIAALIAVALVVYMASQGQTSYKKIVSAPKTTSPYQNVAASDSPGTQWAKALLAENPVSVPQWEVVSGGTPQHPLPNDVCKQEQVPDSVAGSVSAKGSGVAVTVQVYGAGQAAAQFDNYIKRWSKCLNDFEQKPGVSDATVYTFSNGFVMVSGDAILGATASDSGMRDKLLSYYQTKVPETLRATQCLSLTSASADSLRNLFYHPNDYTGLKKSESIKTQVDTSNQATPLPQGLQSVSNPDAEEPEAPLPDGFPSLPGEVAKPTRPEGVSDNSDFSETATYQIEDVNGPGCGWAWSGQKMPVYNAGELASAQKKSIGKAQDDANHKAVGYMQARHNWSGSMLNYVSQVDSWNRYVSQVNAVHDKWSWLNNERSLIEGSWRQYVTDHNDWFTFDDRKKAAKLKFDQETLACNTANENLAKWEQQYGEAWKKEQERAARENGGKTPAPTPSPGATAPPTALRFPNSNPTPTPTADSGSNPKIPDKPTGCTNPPVKDEILDQEKPAEPQPPVIPNGVTIPNSWPQPNK